MMSSAPASASAIPKSCIALMRSSPRSQEISTTVIGDSDMISAMLIAPAVSPAA